MVDFMLDDLRREALESACSLMKVLILILHLDPLKTLRFSYTWQAQAALFGFIFP